MAKKKPKVATEPVMIRSGMLLGPKGRITPGMTRCWKFRGECSPIYGLLQPGQVFRVQAVEGLGPQESTIAPLGAGGEIRLTPEVLHRPSGYVLLKQMPGNTQLKLTGRECRNAFVAMP